MKGSNLIYHKPYCPPILQETKKKPYVCRLAPNERGFEFEWFDNYCDGKHTVWYGIKGSEEKKSLLINDAIVKIDGLQIDTEYEFYIEAENGLKSNIRFLQTGILPKGATVINYLHPEDGQYDAGGQYLGSPTLVRTQSGRMIAGMDVFALKAPQNLTLLFKSEDEGKTWRYLTDLYPFFWGCLFCHRDILYILGLTTEYGNIQIACSKDEGESWSAPVTLFYGSNNSCKYGGFHRAPMQVNAYNGRLYTSCEYGCWEMGSHLPAVISIDENDDLMNAENWVCSEFLCFDGVWKETANGKQFDTIEGNIVRGPDGNLYDYLRWTMGNYLRLKVDENDLEKPLEFSGIFKAPVADSMFRVIQDGEKYLLITNRETERTLKYQNNPGRNVLSVFETEDMEHFTLKKDVINYENEDPQKVGFQYPAFLYEKGALLMVVRAAFNGAHDYHDANYMLFIGKKSDC